ncbi:unnamed protein product [Clonostachys rosea f. rosea IK726]|uniref:Uncharacterized protein n=1 Tax=Clonostachys rosea f. rosea IK726 TaxID=1349383 RepID=A0ACA9UHE8_BIOOC|nr:unnamed protein product [Clonostachys rosea f. rosea IK726]
MSNNLVDLLVDEDDILCRYSAGLSILLLTGTALLYPGIRSTRSLLNLDPLAGLAHMPRRGFVCLGAGFFEHIDSELQSRTALLQSRVACLQLVDTIFKLCARLLGNL